MKKSIFSAILLIACMIIPCSVWADGTFKVLSVCNGNQYSGIPSGSTTESLISVFSVTLEHEAQYLGNTTISLVDKNSGARYDAEKNRIYPNSYYTSTDASIGFPFFSGSLTMEGEWVLTIPAGTFEYTNAETGERLVNEEYVCSWIIQKPYDEPFSIISVTNRGVESGGTVNKLDMYFHVVAEHPIVKCDGSLIEVYKGNAAQGKISNWIYNSDGSCDIVFSQWFEGIVDGKDVGGTTVTGTYTLNIPAGAFRDANNYTSMSYGASWIVTSQATAPLHVDATAKWATLVVPFRLLTLPEGIKVYEVTGLSANNELTLRSQNSITANTPYVVYAENGIDTTIKGIYTDGTPSGKYLQGVYADTYAPVGSFVLQNQDAVNFYKVVEADKTLVKANHCYLTLPSEVQEVKGFVIEDATAIENISASSNDNAIFDLSGRRVEKASKGIYIVNGKKVIY